MYLKTIEVQGFKSFANRIKFEFNDGITAIVGPNGSGKSNVADAVRWVLGEQRVKQLRGGNMQDVIFAGTENRRPLSLATVSITLDNSDHALPIAYDEVTVTRKLYRSGESEYLINGSTVRLKDISELFYDTGIGKEGYSIIGQGQIERILSEKPEDRRELFDEAAGIVKYKRRKSLTQKKLEEERGNLQRIVDILNEIENQLGPLEEQSRTAKEYLKKKEALKAYDINLFLLETQRIEEHRNEIREQLEIVSAELSETNQEYDRTKVEYQEVEEALDLLDASLQESHTKLNQSNMLKQQLEAQIELLKEQINTAHMNDEHLERRSLAIREEIARKDQEVQGLNREMTDLQKNLRSAQETHKAALDELEAGSREIEELEKRIEDHKRAVIETLNSRVNVQAKLQRYDTIMEQNNVRKSQLTAQLLSLKQEEETQNDVIGQLKTSLCDAQANVTAKEDHAHELEAQISEVSKKQKELNLEIDSLTEQFHKETSRLDSLKNLTERYEGYGHAIQKVMEKKEDHAGLIGVVADIITAPKKYELAIETALGGNIQNIVTDSESTAKDMIGYLKENKFGRATFLPLDAIKDPKPMTETDALSETGVLGLAKDLVKAEARYADVVGYLLGRILVVDTIDHAIALARKYKYALRIVTLEGESLAPGGSMTGGAFRHAGNLLGRRREIEELEKKTASLKQKLEKAQQGADKKKAEKTKLYGTLDELSEVIYKLQLEANTLKLNLDTALERQEEIGSSHHSLDAERKELENQLGEIRSMQKNTKQELKASDELEKSLNAQAEADTALLEEQRQCYEKKRSDAEQFNLHLMEMVHRNDFLKENLNRIREESQKLQEELDGLHEDQDASVLTVKEKEENIQKIRETIEASAEVFAEINKEIEEGNARREALNEQHKSYIDRRESLSRHVAELDKEQFRLNARKDGYDEAMEKQTAYMWEEYELTLNQARELRDEELTNLSVIKKQISVLKNEIRELGPININAIEDYKTISERYEFLNGQRNDLIDAENALVEIIGELDLGMQKQFREQFGRIKEEFNTVFRQLFGGGKGTLELTDETDLLESGIRIIAQPPGKKLQNMMQMSGGEKSLTAIALLFAIQNMKPSPFCLLDEIEAALDDANVKRFADYLKRLTKNTQFIMITHRRGTMAVADRLYGITMQEKGVSTLVSVDLVADKLDA